MHLFPNHLVVVASDLEASSLHVVASLYSGYSLLHVLPMFTDTILYSWIYDHIYFILKYTSTRACFQNAVCWPLYKSIFRFPGGTCDGERITQKPRTQDCKPLHHIGSCCIAVSFMSPSSQMLCVPAMQYGSHKQTNLKGLHENLVFGKSFQNRFLSFWSCGVSAPRCCAFACTGRKVSFGDVMEWVSKLFKVHHLKLLHSFSLETFYLSSRSRSLSLPFWWQWMLLLQRMRGRCETG